MSDLETRNYYELLGVERGASEEEIRICYKELARIFHPDSNFFSDIIDDRVDSGADTFKLVTEAYKVLADQKKRAEYDQSLPPVLKEWSVAEDVPSSESAAGKGFTMPNQPEQTPIINKTTRSQIFGAAHNTMNHEREVAQVPSVFDLLTRRRTRLDRILDFFGL